MSIDAHQHFWQLGRNDCTWPTPELRAIHRDFGPEQLAPLAAQAGVTGTVLVQSQASDRDTDFLLELAAHCDLVSAVVAWVDLKSATAPRRIRELAGHSKLRGLRPMLQDLPADDWILDAALEPAVAAMIAHELRFDALVLPRHLPWLLQFAERHPRLGIVVDHGAKPPIASGALEPWSSGIAALARLPNVYCKLSGLLTEARPGCQPRELAPYVAHLLASFGPERLMWGSDWPVLELAGDYSGWHRMARELTGSRDERALRAVFSQTARRFYRI